VLMFFLTTATMLGTARHVSASVITFNEPGLVAGVGPDPYFSGAQKGTLLTNQFASLGVLFSIGVDGAAYISNDSYLGAAGNPAMTGNYLVVNSLPPNNIGLPSTTLHVSFVDPLTGLFTTASGVSAMVTDSNAVPDPRVIVNAFDLLGNLIETHNLTNFWSTL